MIYRIRDWESFETHETRKLDKLRWVAKPNKHDGLSFRKLAARPDRCDLYAAWTLILEIASRGSKGQRGILARDGRALTPKDFELMTGFPAGLFEKALKFFSSPEIGWLIGEGEPDEIPVVPDSTASNGILPGINPAEGRKEGTEGKKEIDASPSARLRVNAIFGRMEKTRWSDKETRTFSKLAIDHHELALVERYYAANRGKPENICRRDLGTFLNNYPGEVDRARKWCSEHPVRSKVVKFALAGPASRGEPDWTEEQKESMRQMRETEKAKLRAQLNPQHQPA